MSAALKLNPETWGQPAPEKRGTETGPKARKTRACVCCNARIKKARRKHAVYCSERCRATIKKRRQRSRVAANDNVVVPIRPAIIVPAIIAAPAVILRLVSPLLGILSAADAHVLLSAGPRWSRVPVIYHPLVDRLEGPHRQALVKHFAARTVESIRRLEAEGALAALPFRWTKLTEAGLEFVTIGRDALELLRGGT
jgi:predicted nucleic acid-binding Zn ribbon protein